MIKDAIQASTQYFNMQANIEFGISSLTSTSQYHTSEQVLQSYLDCYLSDDSTTSWRMMHKLGDDNTIVTIFDTSNSGPAKSIIYDLFHKPLLGGSFSPHCNMARILPKLVETFTTSWGMPKLKLADDLVQSEVFVAFYIIVCVFSGSFS
jgi:hypothetical protein